MNSRRRAKILATIGPASRSANAIKDMISAGADAFRLNASHGQPDEWREEARMVRAVAAEAGRPIAIVFDIAGPKIRLGSNVAPTPFEAGDAARFASEDSGADALPVAFPGFAKLVTPRRSEIVIGDGTPRFAVIGVEGDVVQARCLRGGDVLPRKGVFVTFAGATGAALTEKDLADLDVAAEIEADFVALSFVRSAADVQLLRSELAKRGSRARIIAKIEKLEAVENLPEILVAADGVMVARGDLGVEAGVHEVPLLQKRIIRRATTAGKLVVTATQMLESMLTSAEPTRAEASDIANAVLDGTSALMLSGETAVGEHPVQAVQAMAAIAGRAQEALSYALDIPTVEQNNAEAVLRSAAHLAQQIDAAALVIPTTTGGSVRAAAKCRTPRPIIALARDDVVARQLALEWAVVPATLPAHSGRVEDLIDEAVEVARWIGDLEAGAHVVVTYGQSGRVTGGTDLIVVRQVGSTTRSGFVSDPAQMRED